MSGRNLRPDYANFGQQRAEVIDGVVDLVASGEIALEERTSEAAISDLLGISRSPVRTALAVLAFGGIVSQRPQVGVTFNRTGVSELYDLMKFSQQAELLALRKLSNQDGTHGLAATVRRAREVIHPRLFTHPEDNEAVKRDAEMHRVFIRDSGLNHLSSIVAVTGIKRRIFHLEHPLDQALNARLIDSGISLVEGISRSSALPILSPQPLDNYYSEQRELVARAVTEA